jgi:hypothetical protein
MKLALYISILACILFSTANFAIAQSSFEASGSAGVSYYRAERLVTGGRLNDADQAQFAYRLGAAYSENLSTRWDVSIGVNYASFATSLSFDPQDFRWGDEWDGTPFARGVATPDSFPDAIFVNRTYYLEIPIFARYYFSDDRGLYALAGITPAFHLRYVNTLKQPDAETITLNINTREPVRDFQVALRIGAGKDWTLTERLNFFAQIAAQYYVLKERGDINLRWFDISGQAGVRFILYK